MTTSGSAVASRIKGAAAGEGSASIGASSTLSMRAIATTARAS